MTDAGPVEPVAEPPKPPEPAAPASPSSPSATRTVLGRGSVYTLATAAPALAAVAVIPVVTRLLGKAQYDVVAVAVVVIQVGFILVALGLGAAITRQYILDDAGAAGARALVLQGAAVSLALTAALTAAAPWWMPLVLDRPASAELVLALVACLGGAWMVLAQAYLRGADRAVAFVVLAALAGLAGPVAGLVGLAVGHRSPLVYLVGLAAGYVAAGVVGLGLVAAAGPLAGNRAGLQRALRIGLPTVPHQVSLYVALAGLVVVADRLLGEGGRANVALTIGAGATVLTAGLNNAWAPVVYRTAPADRPRVLTQTTRPIAVITLVVAGAVALLGPWLLRVAAPHAYDPASLVPALALAAAAAVPSVVYLASGHLVFASGRTGPLAASTPLAVAGALVWAVLLAPHWGMAAIGSAYLVAYLLLAAGTTAVQRGVSPTPWWPPVQPLLLAAWAGTTALGALLPGTGAGAVARVAAVVGLLTVAAVRLRRRPLPHPSASAASAASSVSAAERIS